MAPITNKRPRGEENERRPKKKIRIRKQKAYHSSSEDEDEEEERPAVIPTGANAAPRSILKQPVVLERAESDADSDIEGLDDIPESERNFARNAALAANEDDDDDDETLNLDEEADDDDDEDEDELGNDEYDIESQSQTSSQAPSSTTSSAAARRKRNDPSAFATSITKILETKLTASKRPDPILSRSKNAADANASLQEAKLDAAARAQLRAERKQKLNKGRITDLLGLTDESVDTGRVVEEEKRLRKVAQRGVVRLFNAVRAAQIGAERAVKGEEGTVGRKARDERVSEMSKEGFLEMISRGSGGVKT